MHKSCCGCAKCQAGRNGAFFAEGFGAGVAPGPMSEAEEMELATELLSVATEDEMDQFLGKLFQGIGRGLKKFGQVVKPFAGALRGIAKTALPIVGGALGSFIPVPGVGTAIGSAIGRAVGKAFELELGELPSEESEFESARRIVRMAETAARMADRSAGASASAAVVRDALLAAARQHVPLFAAHERELMAQARADGEVEYAAYEAEDAYPAGAQAGRWIRRGNRIVLTGA